MTPKELREAAQKLRDADVVLDKLNYGKPATPGWSMLVGFDLDFLADEFDKQAEYIEQKL